jgi:hypothetical protein
MIRISISIVLMVIAGLFFAVYTFDWIKVVPQHDIEGVTNFLVKEALILLLIISLIIGSIGLFTKKSYGWYLATFSTYYLILKGLFVVPINFEYGTLNGIATMAFIIVLCIIIGLLNAEKLRLQLNINLQSIMVPFYVALAFSIINMLI